MTEKPDRKTYVYCNVTQAKKDRKQEYNQENRLKETQTALEQTGKIQTATDRETAFNKAI